MGRSALVRLGLLALAALLGSACRSGPPPNVLLIVLDTTRADAVAAYGAYGANSEPTDGAPTAFTPVLDELARDGVLYANARSTSPWTVPAHASLFTGLYPSRHGVHFEMPGLPEEQVTLAELLAGTHETAGFSENPHIVAAKGYAQGFRVFEETWRLRRSWEEPPITLELVARWLAQRDRKRPFFVFVNLMTPHLPYTPPVRYQRRFVSETLEAEQAAERLREIGESHARSYMSGALAVSDADFEVLRALYRAEVSFGDEQVGRVLQMLRSQEVLEQTLVIVVGDHGENIGDHGLMEHQLCLYESLLRVPLILRLPGTFDGGERREAHVQLVDVMPTVLEALGVDEDAWPAMQGHSLLDGDPPEARPVLAEYIPSPQQKLLFSRANPSFDFTPFERRLRSVQQGKLKLIVSDRGDEELYDLAQDPGELRNLARERGSDVEKLRAVLGAVAPAWPQPEHVPGAGAVDEETRRALQELGYVE